MVYTIHGARPKSHLNVGFCSESSWSLRRCLPRLKTARPCHRKQISTFPRSVSSTGLAQHRFLGSCAGCARVRCIVGLISAADPSRCPWSVLSTSKWHRPILMHKTMRINVRCEVL